MKIQLWSIGKPHESYVKEGIDLFTKRISHYYTIDWKIIPMPKNAGIMEPSLLKIKEGEAIINLIQKDDFLILLDEKGKNLCSLTLSAYIEKLSANSYKNVIFLIGGAFGVSSEVALRAQFTWSLSALVLPHQLVRLILVEQIYRACTIAKNEKYHHA